MAEVNNISRSFADNVNYVAELDNQYYKTGFLKRNGVQLSTTTYSGVVKLNVFDMDTKQHNNSIVYTADIVGNAGLEGFITSAFNAIKVLHPDVNFTISITDSTGVIVDKNIDVSLSSTTTILGLIQVDISMYLSPGVVADYTKYSITSGSDNYISVLTYLSMLDDDFNNSVLSIVEIANDIITVSNNVTSVSNVSSNINSVNTVSNNIDSVIAVANDTTNIDTVASNIGNVNIVSTGIINVGIVGSSIDDVNTVASNISDVHTTALRDADIKRVADDLNAIDANGRSDIIIVSDNLVKGSNSELIKVSDSIANVNLVGNEIGSVVVVADNIDSIVVDANNISRINLIASDLTMAGLDNIVDAGSIADDIDTASPGVSMIETVSDNIANVNSVGSNINSVISVASNETNINSVVTDIIPVIAEILEADTNAAIATAKAAEASASETMAHKWSSEPEDSIVTGTLGVDDEYSAYHWAKKAESAAGGSITLNSLYDVDTTGILDGGLLRYNTATTTWVSYDFTRNDKIGLDLTAGTVVAEGEMAWNATEGTADLGLPGGSTLQLGQENIRTIRNGTVSTITDGTLCMFDGTIGNSGRIKVKPFTAGFNEAMYLYGVATQTITSGSDGIITIEGKVRGIDTTGASVGEVWNDEDILYAKPNDNGRMTKVVPADNELKLVVATVIHAHTSGTLEIRFTPMNENLYYTKVQNDILLNSKVPLDGDFTLDLGGII